MYFAYITTNTTMQLEQSRTSYSLLMPQPTQPRSLSNISPAMYLACHHQHNDAARAIQYKLFTARATTSTTMQLDQPLDNRDVLMPPPPIMQVEQLFTSCVMFIHHQHNHAAESTSKQT